MKVAIISDVHGNRLALEAVLDDITREGVDATFNLGDMFSGPLEPNWTADILMDLDLPSVCGNHDRALRDSPPEKLGPIDRFAQEQMDIRHRIWINDLPETLALLDDVFLCHGTPTSDEEPWLAGWWNGRTSTSHVPRAVRLRDGRLIVNPGAGGVQFNHGSPDARYAIVERRDGKYYPQFRAVPYDHFAAARMAEANGFPNWREALITGWVGAAGLF